MGVVVSECSDILEIPPPLSHPFDVSHLVVVLVEYVGGDIGSTAYCWD